MNRMQLGRVVVWWGHSINAISICLHIMSLYSNTCSIFNLLTGKEYAGCAGAVAAILYMGD